MRILVVPASALPETLAGGRPDRVVTIASPGRPVPPVPTGPDRLHLAFHDIAAPATGLTEPGPADIERLLAFGRERWRSMVVSCEFGVSRSPAAAFVLACQACPGLDPAVLARRLRRRSPQATPNARVIALADAALGRSGAMVDAIRVIGRGREYSGPEPFRLDLAAGGAA